MSYYSDSFSEPESGDPDEVIAQVMKEDDITQAAWYTKYHSDEENPRIEQPTGPDRMTARAYQLEMLEASLKENIICAMDTGSGKTQVAILRIRAELERMPADQVIWFLAPTVSLCTQQYQVMKTQFPSIEPKLIVGSNKVDSWSGSTWEVALVNVKIVITTPQVLLDALIHGYVRISSLALLIFDEAHHCDKKHAYSRIMKEFYWEAKIHDLHVPHILGLTASPVRKSDIASLEQLEFTLNSICRSPTRHREELLAHSQRPSLFSVTYGSKTILKHEFTDSMNKIHVERQKARDNILKDPEVLALKAENTPRSIKKLERAIMQQRTYVLNLLGSLCRRTAEISKDLGTWSADWYLYEAIRIFNSGIINQGGSSERSRDCSVVYLARIFQDANIKPPPPLKENSIFSDKVHQLIDVLLGYKGDGRGIIFVKERATTVILAHILATHPKVREKYRVGKMVGTSFVPGFRQDFIDLPEKDGHSSLNDFRSGKKNLIVATSVLEEGIDVPACNIVICIDLPKNLKSFIQRRGRARMKESHFYLFMDKDEKAKITPTNDWDKLEADMKQHYEDEQREIQRIQVLEDSETVDYPELRVESTGARLTINDAKSHLQHFCASISSKKYVDYHPEYIIKKLQPIGPCGDPPLLSATVILPISVPQHIREAKSSRSWISEKNACMDAAFQAYKALYEAQLIDEHLLPLKTKLEQEIESRSGFMDVRTLYNPWLDIAKEWNGKDRQLHRKNLLVFDHNGSKICEFEIGLPSPIPEMKPMVVWWDHHTQLTLRIDSDLAMTDPGDGNDRLYPGTTSGEDHTSVLLSLAFMHRRMDIKEDCVLRIASPSGSLSMSHLGNVAFSPDLVVDGGLSYLVRDERDEYRHPYYYDSFLLSKPPPELIQKAYKGFEEDLEDMPYLAVKKWPKKTGFFHRPVPPQHNPSTKPYARVLPAQTTTVDSVPTIYAQFGLLIPSLIYYMETYLLATKLSTTLLEELCLEDVSRVVEAICTTSARTPTNYERVEFLGDSLLKTCITLNVAATYLRLPEGLLSILKDRIVSNARLCRAAHAFELDRFIVTQQLALKKWRPPYVSELLEQSREETTRMMSTKTLADVVEAIIGVSYLDGGLPKALKCIGLILPEAKVRKDLDAVRNTLLSAAQPKNATLPVDLQPLEELINYTFREKTLLVESMTHPSYNMVGTVSSYDRLEFVGDAILDFIIVQELYAIEDPAPLENWQMHLLRTALVNADILGFLVMEWTYKQPRFEIYVGGSASDSDSNSNDNTGGSYRYGGGGGGGDSVEVHRTDTTIPLWSFMRQASAELVTDRVNTEARYAVLQEHIRQALDTGMHYPWALLAQLRAQKFYGDLYEALVGAIWVDSGPDFVACREFVENSGLLKLLRRLLRDKVHLLHPKEELGRLADTERVEYVMAEVVTENGEDTVWTCEIRIGGRPIVAAKGCLFREEARVRAATKACEILKGGSSSE